MEELDDGYYEEGPDEEPNEELLLVEEGSS